MRWLISSLLFPAFTTLAACSSSSGTPVDASVDTASVDVCLTCASGQICVARYDGTCHGQSMCINKTLECAPNTCSTDCEAAYCPSPYQCKNRAACPGESPHAFKCYGP